MISNTAELLSGPLPDVRVGIGRGSDRGYVERSVECFDGVEIYDDPTSLVDDLVSGRIDAAVRGDLTSEATVPALRKGLGVGRLERAVFLEPPNGRVFIMAPVGIDEGWTDSQKVDMAARAADLARRVGADPRIAVMSGGRDDDRGRCPQVDATIDSAERVVEALRRDGYDAYGCQILIEEAAVNAGVVIATDGITGNIMFRTLHFLGGAQALGAPVLNAERVFVDTSRAKTDYRDSIALAKRLTEA